jgi:hypothetical protein
MADANPQYRFLITETSNVGVSNQANFLGELIGLYGLYMDKNLSKPGNMTFSFRVDNPLMDRTNMENWTRPGQRSIWVYRGGILAWSGIIWSRTYQSNGRVVNCTAQTADSYLDRVIFPFNYTDFQFPHNIILDLWSQIPTIVGTYFLGRYPRDWAISPYQSGFGAGNTLTVDGYQAPTLASLVDTCVKWGGEYRIQADEFGSLIGRWNYVQVGMWPPPGGGTEYTVGLQKAQKQIVIQYPGSIANYWWPESLGVSAGGASSVYLVGKGATKAATPFALVNNNSLVGNTMISTSKRVYDQSISDQTQLNTAAANIAPLFQQPITNPTFELDVSHSDIFLPYNGSFAGLDVGDYFDYIITDKWRFPHGRKGEARVAGWVLKPPSDEGPEQFGISIVDKLSTITQDGS